MHSGYTRKLIEDINNKLEHERTYYRNISRVVAVFDNMDEIPPELIKKNDKSIRTMELLSTALKSLNEILLL